MPQWRSKFLPKLVEVPKDLETLIFFYLSIKINTTTLERNLGELCRQLAAHTGRTAEDSGQLTASLLEVALDGPQREEELFERIDDSEGKSKLSPTEFGRACARLWVEQFGRRFRYKYLGRTSQKKHAARPGSFKAVLLRREAATDKLAKMGKSRASGESFVPGLVLPLAKEKPAVNANVLQGTRWASSAPGSHAKGKFETHTERKKERCLAMISVLVSHRCELCSFAKQTLL